MTKMPTPALLDNRLYHFQHFRQRVAHRDKLLGAKGRTPFGEKENSFKYRI